MKRNITLFRAEYQDIDVMLNTEKNIGGFDFLMAFDAGGLTFINTDSASSVLFTETAAGSISPINTVQLGIAAMSCQSGMIRVVGFAEYHPGDIHPSYDNVERQ